MSAYKPSELLQRKRHLIKLVKLSNEKYEMELFNQATYKHLLGRLDAQQEYEICMIRELDPYFQF